MSDHSPEDRLSSDTVLLGPQAGYTRGLSVSISFVLFVVVFVAYSPVLSHELLQYDDDLNIIQNKNLSPPSTEGLLRIWSSGYEGLYIPLTYSAWFVVSLISTTTDESTGQIVHRAFAFHALNLMLHAGCVQLIYRLLLRLVGHPLAAAAGALLFAIHPLQVESVAWVSETKGLLSALCALLAMVTYIEFVRRQEARQPVWCAYLMALSFFVLAMLAKPIAVGIPLALLILEIVLWRRGALNAMRSLAAWFAIAACFVLITRGQQTTDHLVEATSLGSRLLIAGDSITFYLGKLLWPVALAPHYPRTIGSALKDPWLPFYIALPLLLVFVLAILPNRRQWLTSLGLFVVALLPVLGLVPFAYQEFANVADRYAYMAMLGPALAVSFWYRNRPRIWKSVTVLSVACVLIMATRKQCTIWEDTETLFLHTLRVNPTSFRAENALGCVYASQSDLSQAIPHFQAAVESKPDYAQAHFNLANSLAAVGDLTQAIDHLEVVTQLQPNSAIAFNNLGSMLFRVGRIEESIVAFERAGDLEPDWKIAWDNLAITLLQADRETEALEIFEKVIVLDPLDVPARLQRAEILVQLGRNQDAIKEYQWLQNHFASQGDFDKSREMENRSEELR